MKVLIVFLLIIGIEAAGQEASWNKVRDRNGVKVYNRSIEGIDFKEFMGEVEIEAEIDVILSIFNDVEQGTKWIENVDHMEELERKNEFESYTYTYSKAPWPVKDRDAVAYNKTIENLEKGEIIIIQEGAPKKISNKEDVVRVERLNSNWVFREEDKGVVHVRYQVLTDPGGRLPAWLINKVSVSQPYETLLGLKKLAENQ